MVRFTHVSRFLTGALIAGSLSAVAVSSGPALAAASVDAHGSVNQVYVVKARPGTMLTLKNSKGKVVARTHANKLGGALFRNVPRASGYSVTNSAGAVRRGISVHDDASTPWNTDFY